MQFPPWPLRTVPDSNTTVTCQCQTVMDLTTQLLTLTKLLNGLDPQLTLGLDPLSLTRLLATGIDVNQLTGMSGYF